MYYYLLGVLSMYYIDYSSIMQEYDAAAVHTDALEAIPASFSLGGAIDLNMATGFRPTQYSYRLTRKTKR